MAEDAATQNQFTVISPSSQSPLITLPFDSTAEITEKITAATTAFPSWQNTPLEQRIALLHRFVDIIDSEKDDIVQELALYIGRPVRYGQGEVNGFCFRARHMLSIAPSVLSPIHVSAPETQDASIHRYMKRVPVGPVLIISAWNYPYLVAVNGILPALVAGCTVLFKTSPQSPICAQRLYNAAEKAGIPHGVFQVSRIHAIIPSFILVTLFRWYT